MVCALAALCYAEFASTVPVAGSAYTFSYASIGELPAWIIGWDLVLELALGAAVVAVGWSGYVRSLLDTVGFHLPRVLSGSSDSGGFGFDLLAFAPGAGAHRGAGRRDEAVRPGHHGRRGDQGDRGADRDLRRTVLRQGRQLHPFVPKAQTSGGESGLAAPLIQLMFGYTPTTFGVMGVFSAAAVVFFAFIGFDIVATAAEETKNPQRDVPRGILGSLVICTVLYVAVSVVVTGMEKYTKLSVDAPLADAFKANGAPFWAGIISFGAAIGLTSVCMILLLGQTRVFFAMSRDGLLPRSFASVHPKYGTPYRATMVLGIIVAVLAGFTNISQLSELVNIGTLFAFVVVAVGVIVLRRTRPDLPRSFRTPLVPLVPVLSVCASLWLMLNLPVETWLRFAVWMVIGFAVYFFYGKRHSRMGNGD